tara:strand:+ start:111 stop:443 length:333 start_codon:yes stop_codon:yes gene_type:complete
MAKDTGNPSIKVRLTPEMIRALDRVVEVGQYDSRSEVVREFTLILIEAVVQAHEHGRAWKGTWEIFKGIQRLNDRFAKVAKTARDSRQQDLFGNNQEPDYLEEMKEVLTS